MLDAADFKAISDLMDSKLAVQKAELLAEVDQKLLEMEKRLVKENGRMTRMLFDGDILPQIKTIAEANKTMNEVKASKDHFYVLQDEISDLRVLVNTIARQVSEFKKAGQ